MVVAYLRGLLKPSINHGLRSIVAENYVLEMLAADNQAQTLEAASLSDAALLSSLTRESKIDTLRSIRKRQQRCMELRNGDIYRVGKRKEHARGEISLYQLYHLCARAGILDTLSGTKKD